MYHPHYPPLPYHPHYPPLPHHPHPSLVTLALHTPPISPSLPTPLTSLPILQEERIALDGEREEVRCLLELLHSQAYACHNIRHVQRLRRTLTAASWHMSSILCNKPSPAQWRKRSTNTRDTSFPKKTSLGSPSPLACS